MSHEGGGFGVLFGAFARLPHLRSLELSQLMPSNTAHSAAVAAWLESAAAVQLAAAKQLTSLRVWRCDWFTDSMLSDVARGLCGLRVLYVQYQQQITDAALPVIASSLQHLARLGLSGTSVTNTGLRDLRMLPNLRVVEVPGSCAPWDPSQ